MPTVPNCVYCACCYHCILSPCGRRESLPVKQVEFRRGVIIYIAGLPAQCIFVVQSGSVSLTSVDALGNQRIASFVRPGEALGLDSFLSRHTHLFTAVARENSRVCFAASAEFKRFAQHDNERMWRLVLLLAELAHDVQVEKIEISGQRVQKRLQSAVARLTRMVRDTASRKLPVTYIKQCELAQFLGVPEETVSRGLKHLRLHVGHLMSGSNPSS